MALFLLKPLSFIIYRLFIYTRRVIRSRYFNILLGIDLGTIEAMSVFSNINNNLYSISI